MLMLKNSSLLYFNGTGVKSIIFHPKFLPSIVILDPVLTVGLPSKLTAATGMDALAHNLEAYCAPGYHPMADGIALEGIRIFFDRPFVETTISFLLDSFLMVAEMFMGSILSPEV